MAVMTAKWKVFADMLLNGDEQAAYQLVEEADSDSLTIYVEIMTKAMQYIGELWQKNRITVADEHLATSVCDFVLSQYSFPFKRRNTFSKGKIMFLCLEEEQHMLGSKMAAALCSEKGWKTRLLGANLPLEYALQQAAEWEPDVIGLSAALSYRLPLLQGYIDSLENLAFRPQVIVGGRIAGNYNVYKYGSEETAIFDSLHALDQWLDRSRGEVEIDGAS
ncbi:cobalamin B12-binding domain-containing protein [Sediminibacillus terrae]|uniref:cobalamin B12-binding domain-containing protein n=1 Tax=Sediminibacillus terrae TaxID=1562106 RepID=UPI0009DF4721|nr:B12-binding domain-containing protein [Sediminibacillus terrae]